MKKAMQITTAVIFCLFIGGFGILHLVLPDREFSPTENRNLDQFPEFTWDALVDGTFTADLEEYLSDQFPMRDDWMGLKARYEYLLGKREFHNVFLSGDTLLSKITDTGRAEQNLEHIKKLLEKTDIPTDEIALQCGFNDVKQLHLWFNKRMGTSPGRYRREFVSRKQTLTREDGTKQEFIGR